MSNTSSQEPAMVEMVRQLRKCRTAADKARSAVKREKAAGALRASLVESLQAAVTLEFATIPPYLCALWSIENDLDPVAESIREIVQEEMLHMALTCNMMSALGAAPQINCKDAVPSYPTSLPMGIHQGLVVSLSGLNCASLANFLWIERPVHVVEFQMPESSTCDPKLLTDQQGTDSRTIGEFYDEIRESFRSYLANPKNPRLVPDRQITGPLSWRVIRNMEDVEGAIKLIQEQGEGSKYGPEERSGDLSHYYRFLEVFHGVTYEWVKESRVLQSRDPLPFPGVWPMADVPEGGYKDADVPKRVAYYLGRFDDAYSRLLDELQDAWTLGGQADLVRAYATMFELERYAKPLIQTPIEGRKDANYGPCFRYKAPAERGTKDRDDKVASGRRL